jgi:heme-degrading monooxygenase HmoA
MKKEMIMAIKILIKRTFKKANPKNVYEVIYQFRQLATKQKGYISSESLHSCDDPNLILVLSMWQKKEDWDRYMNSSDRQEIETKYSELFERPPEYEAFHLGLEFGD